MKLLEVSALAIRFIGIFLFIFSVQHFMAWLLSSKGFDEGADVAIAIFFMYGFPLILSLAFILFPVSIAKVITPKSSVAETENTEGTIRFLYALTIVLGLYLIASALPDIVYTGLTIISIYKFDAINASTSTTSNTISLISHFTELAIGLLLTLKTKAVISIISKAKNSRD